MQKVTNRCLTVIRFVVNYELFIKVLIFIVKKETLGYYKVPLRKSVRTVFREEYVIKHFIKQTGKDFFNKIFE